MIYDIYGTVVNQLITGKPTAQAGLSMAKLHAVPSPSEPAARCRWHRWWGLCCCNQDLPGSTIKIGKGHQDLKSKCEYIYIYYYILYIIIYYIILYTILYCIYIYHCPWKTATVKSAHSSHGFLRCRGTVHMNFGATTLGGPFFVELVVVIQHHTGHLHQAKQRRKNATFASRKNHWTNVEMAWTIHWSHDLPIEYVFIYIYVYDMCFPLQNTCHRCPMWGPRSNDLRPTDAGHPSPAAHPVVSTGDLHLVLRSSWLLLMGLRLDLLGDHLEIGNIYLSIFIYLFIYLFIYCLYIYPSIYRYNNKKKNNNNSNNKSHNNNNNNNNNSNNNNYYYYYIIIKFIYIHTNIYIYIYVIDEKPLEMGRKIR